MVFTTNVEINKNNGADPAYKKISPGVVPLYPVTNFSCKCLFEKASKPLKSAKSLTGVVLSMFINRSQTIYDEHPVPRHSVMSFLHIPHFCILRNNKISISY